MSVCVRYHLRGERLGPGKHLSETGSAQVGRARVMRGRRFVMCLTGLVTAWIAGLALAACGDDPEAARQAQEDIAAESGNREQTIEQNLVVSVAPRDVKPGAVAELRFADEVNRGVGYWLERRQDHGWERRYHAVAAPHEGGAGPDSPSTAPAGDPLDVPDLVVADRGPDRLVVPDTAEPGRWRVCHQGSPLFCGEFTVSHGKDTD